MKDLKDVIIESLQEGIEEIAPMFVEGEWTEEDDMLCESFEDSNLQLLAKYLKSKKLKWNNTLGWGSYKWDEVKGTAYHINSEEPKNIEVKPLRNALKIGAFILVLQDDIPFYWISKIRNGYDVTYLYNGISTTTYTTQSAVIDEVVGRAQSGHNIVYVVYDPETSAYKRIDRVRSREGMIVNTPEAYEEYAKQNIERYKKMILSKKVDEKYENVKNDVANFLNRAQAYILNIITGDSEEGSAWRAKELTIMIERIIESYDSFLNYFKGLKDNDNYTRADYADKRIKELIDRIENIILSAEQKYKI